MATDGRLEPDREVKFPNLVMTGYRVTANGKWTSKLGRWQDIEHELDGLVGEMYGAVKQILKRATAENGSA